MRKPVEVANGTNTLFHCVNCFNIIQFYNCFVILKLIGIGSCGTANGGAASRSLVNRGYKAVVIAPKGGATSLSLANRG